MAEIEPIDDLRAGLLPLRCAERLRQLLVFVASIDERTEVIATPARIGGSSGFDPDVCGQWR